MIDIESKLNEFCILPVLDQKDKLIKILSQIQDSAPKFKEVLKFIEETDFPRSEYLIEVYKNIVDIANEMSQQETKQNIVTENNIQNKIQIIKSKEKEEKESINLDNILNTI